MSLDQIPERFRLPDSLWQRMTPLIPPERPKPKGGRPREDDRKMMTAIVYIAKTGCQWNALPCCLGASTTVHDRFQEWRRAGVFRRAWVDALGVYDVNVGLDWEWQSMDGAMTKAPLGGEKRAPIQRIGRSRARSAAFRRKAAGSRSRSRSTGPTATTT